MLFLTWRAACRHGLLREGVPRGVIVAVRARIVGAQSLYAGGAALGMIDTRIGVAAILLTQSYFVIAPRWPRRDR